MRSLYSRQPAEQESGRRNKRVLSLSRNETDWAAVDRRSRSRCSSVGQRYVRQRRLLRWKLHQGWSVCRWRDARHLNHKRSFKNWWSSMRRTQPIIGQSHEVSTSDCRAGVLGKPIRLLGLVLALASEVVPSFGFGAAALVHRTAVKPACVLWNSALERVNLKRGSWFHVSRHSKYS